MTQGRILAAGAIVGVAIVLSWLIFSALPRRYGAAPTKAVSASTIVYTVSSSASVPPVCDDTTSRVKSTYASPRSVTKSDRRPVPAGTALTSGSGTGAICDETISRAWATVPSPYATSRSTPVRCMPSSAT